MIVKANPAGILGTGHYVPDKIVTNADLEKMVETSDEWIQSRTGIRERHIAPDGINTSDMCTIAARQALEMAHTKPEEVDDYRMHADTGYNNTLDSLYCSKKSGSCSRCCV